MKKIIILSSILFFVSCKFNSSEKIETKQIDTVQQIQEEKKLPPLEAGEVFLKNQDPFGEVIELKGEHFIPDTFIFVPKEPKMAVKNNLMVMKIFDYSKGAQPYIMFQYPEMKFIKKVGVMGNGPGEFMFADIIFTPDTSILCHLFELSNEKMYDLDFQGNITPNSFKFTSSIERGASEKRYIHAIDKDRFIYVDNSKTGKSIFLTYQENDSIKNKEIASLQLNKKNKSPLTYIGDFGINIQKDRMIYAYKYFKILKFMDTKGNKVRTLNYAKDEFDESSLKMVYGLDNNTSHYGRICAQDNYVYCVYIGRKPAIAYKENMEGNHYIYIEQYDWNGNPIKKYKLDKWGEVYVDEKRGEILLVTVVNDDPFYRFKLPQ